jgi:hypothetical protein
MGTNSGQLQDNYKVQVLKFNTHTEQLYNPNGCLFQSTFSAPVGRHSLLPTEQCPHCPSQPLWGTAGRNIYLLPRTHVLPCHNTKIDALPTYHVPIMYPSLYPLQRAAKAFGAAS